LWRYFHALRVAESVLDRFNDSPIHGVLDELMKVDDDIPRTQLLDKICKKLRECICNETPDKIALGLHKLAKPCGLADGEYYTLVYQN